MSYALPQPKVRHLMRRAAFGTTLASGPADLRQLYKESEKVVPLAEVAKPDVDREDMQNLRDNPARKEMLKKMFNKSREELMNLNKAWMMRMVNDPSLREKMTFFWHDHFACRTLVPWFAQQQNNTIRNNALGSFGDLLMAISKDPAMLQFLNNQQNRKGHPNENFAREVMELFTLGRGNYTEKDVKEAARAFTGWGFNVRGEYQFRPRQHDYETKTFRESTGPLTGEQILQSILEDKQTAKFITGKLYRYFVNDQPVDEGIVNDWADSFYRSGLNIKKLLTQIFESAEFNKPENTGSRIKSPIELLIGYKLHTGGVFENPQSLIFLQRALGQVLFYPPNVSGWPSGKAWIDSSSLTFRIVLPTMLFADGETDFQPGDDGDANGIGDLARGKRKLQFKTDWANLAQLFTKSTSGESLAAIEDFLLARPTNSHNRELVAKTASTAISDEEFIKKSFIGFMSLPDYQLC